MALKKNSKLLNIKTEGKIIKLKDLAIALSSFKIRRKELRKIVKVLSKLELIELTGRPGFIRIKDKRIFRLFSKNEKRI